MAIDAGGLENSDQNRKLALSIYFTKINHLLVIYLADDDARELHLNRH
jgi:hypothetical protein